MRVMKFSVSPVVRIAVEPKNPAVAMEVMVVTPADPEAKPQEVCPGVCGVASKCVVGVAAATVDAVDPQETSLIRERGIKTKKKKKKLQNMLFPHSESALFKFKKNKTSKNNYQIPTIVKTKKKKKKLQNMLF